MTLEQNPRVTAFTVTNIPVDLTDLQPGLIAVSDPIPVAVVLQGLRDDLEQVTIRNFRATLPLDDLAAGSHFVEVALDVSAATSVEVVRVVPAELPVTLEALVTRAIPIELISSGQPQSGFAIDAGGITVTPPEATMTGRESLLQTADRVKIELDLDESARTSAIQLTGRPVDTAGNEIFGLSLVPRLFTVLVPVSPIRVTRNVPVAVELFGNPAPGFAVGSVDVNPPTTRISGLPEAVATVESVSTETVVVRGQRQLSTVEVTLVAPDGVTLVNPGVRHSVTVDVDTIVSTASLADVIEINLPDEFLVSISPPIASIVVEGTSQAVLGLTPQQLETSVDIADQPVIGVHILTPRVVAPASVRVISIDPVVVTVTVTNAPAAPTPVPTAEAPETSEDPNAAASGPQPDTGEPAAAQ